MKLLNEKGVSLVGVMTAGGVLSLMAVGMMKMFSGGFKQDAKLRKRQAVREFTQTMSFLMTDNCGKADTETWTIDITKPDVIDIPVLHTKLRDITDNTTYGELTISDINITPKTTQANSVFGDPEAGENYHKVGDNSYLAQLNFQITSGVANINEFNKNSYLDIIVTLNSSGEVESCRRMSDIAAQQEFCDGIEGVTADWNEDEAACEITATVEQGDTVINNNVTNINNAEVGGSGSLGPFDCGNCTRLKDM